LSALVVALLLGGWSACRAQEAPAGGLKPLVTVSFSGYDELKADIEFVGKLSDNPKMAQQMEGMLNLFTAGQGLVGLDTTKPWGAVVQTDGQEGFPIYGFIPVTDLKQLIALAKDPLTGQPLAKLVDGVYHVQTDGPTLFVQEKGGWAFIANDLQHLANAPADPQKVLGGLNDKYDLAVRASVQNVPAVYRELFLMQMQMGAEMATQQLPGESDEDYAIRQGVTKQALQQVAAMLNDLDEVLIGWAIDRQTGTSYVDFQITAVAGTTTAAQFTQAATARTNFAGFELPGAALTGNWASKLADSDVAQAKTSIANLRATALRELKNQGLSADELKLATQLLSDMLDVLQKTVEAKTLDGGMVLLLKPGSLTFAIGGAIADGAKLEKALKQLAKEIQKEEPDLAKLLKLDAETHQGVRFHTLAIPTEEMDSKSAVKAFGETLDVVAGISETSVYVSVGRDAASTLKQVIDQSKTRAGEQIPPMKLSLAATPIAQFVASMAEADGDEETQQMAGMIAAMLAQSGGKDHLTLTSKPIPNGATVRLEIEEGILKLIGSLGQMFGGMAIPGGPGLPGDAATEEDSIF
jgi:hypothetical protein